MGNSPLVSVIITVFNRAQYVKESIESVLDSSYKNFELIIADDQSTDDSVKIINQYSAYKNVKIHINPKNLGQFQNRNYAATFATGKYVKYLDSDDTIYKYGLETMVEIIESFPNAGAAISHDLPNEKRPYPILLNPEEAYKASFLTGGFPFSGPSASIILREAFINTGGFPKPYYVGTDLIFWLKLATIYPIVKMQPNLIWYRQHEDQALNKGIQSNEYLEKDFVEFSKLLNEPDCPLSDDNKTKALTKLKIRFNKQLLKHAILHFSPIEAYKILKNSKKK